MAKKVTRKKLLKEPDEFITTTGRLIRWARQYRTLLTVAASAFFVILIAIAGFRYLANQAENRAFTLLGQAVIKYENLTNSMGPEKAYPAVKEDFMYIINKYKNKQGGKMAGLFFANLSLEAGSTDPAILLYERALKDWEYEASLKNFILNSLGYAYEQKHDYPQSIVYFQKIAEGDDPVMKDVALFNLGRLYAELGDSAKSKEVFSRLISDHTDSVYFEIAKERIAG